MTKRLSRIVSGEKKCDGLWKTGRSRLPWIGTAAVGLLILGGGCGDDSGAGTQDGSIDVVLAGDASVDATVDSGVIPGECQFGDDPICEAPEGYHCWYVSTEGSDEADGSFETPFRTIQHAVETMGRGDIVYLRGGRYEENVQIPEGQGGTCIDRDCSEGSWSTIKSYPCEWAVIDGGHRDKHVIGHWHSGSSSGEVPAGWTEVLPDGTIGEIPEGSWGGLADIHFWRVEHLEITGGCQESGGAGWAASGGPFQIRYVYFHDNAAQTRDANPGGIRGYTWHDSLVEHCRFENNGCLVDDGNCADINIFSDYATSRNDWTRELWEANGPHQITYATRNNEYRYNYFEGTPVGIKHKSFQILADRSGEDFRYAALGDRIHHNIFVNNSHAGVITSQDFAQVHHNIFIDSDLSNGQYHNLDMVFMVTYNNLVVHRNIRYHVSYYGPEDSDWSVIIIHFKPWYFCMNNIVEAFENEWDAASISLGVGMDKDDSGEATVDLSESIVDHNYVYRPVDPEHYRIGRNAGPCSDWLTTEQMNDCWQAHNYTNQDDAQDPLHQGSDGADALKVRMDHHVAATETIGESGIGIAHPYLDGVTIPSYVGPCPDDRCQWVDDVLAQRDDPATMVQWGPE